MFLWIIEHQIYRNMHVYLQQTDEPFLGTKASQVDWWKLADPVGLSLKMGSSCLLSYRAVGCICGFYKFPPEVLPVWTCEVKTKKKKKIFCVCFFLCHLGTTWILLGSISLPGLFFCFFFWGGGGVGGGTKCVEVRVGVGRRGILKIHQRGYRKKEKNKVHAISVWE